MDSKIKRAILELLRDKKDIPEFKYSPHIVVRVSALAKVTDQEVEEALKWLYSEKFIRGIDTSSVVGISYENLEITAAGINYLVINLPSMSSRFWKYISQNPLLSNLIGGAIGGAISGALVNTFWHK